MRDNLPENEIGLELQKKILLYSSNELDAGEVETLEKTLVDSEVASEYLEELRAIESCWRENLQDLSGVDGSKQNITNEGFSFVANALSMPHITGQYKADPVRKGSLKPLGSSWLYIAGSVVIALGFASLSRGLWLSETSSESGTDDELVKRITRQDSTDIHFKTNDRMSVSFPRGPVELGSGDQNPARRVSESLQPQSNSIPKTVKRKSFRVRSELLVKIQNTRSKIKNLKKRMEKQS